YSNRTAYANTVVRIKGQVTKVNLGIMGKNWIHLQDGTGDTGSNDLLVTTQETVTLGDIVIFEGTIALNKDFGSGYSYEVLMEDAKRQSE
ncbi:MAG: OB-fold nucleic acid binding domain-containing protein, partial [Planctomycetota bacterium]